MALYKIRAEGTEYPLNIVSSSTWGGTQQTVIYEAPGTNGGIVMVTGRTTNTITLTGKFTTKDNNTPLLTLNAIKNKFNRLKDKGIPVTLIAPIDNDDTGVYLITSFTGNVVEGISNSLPFEMTLTEYRQSNLKRTAVNLISFGPAEEFRRVLRERLVG